MKRIISLISILLVIAFCEAGFASAQSLTLIRDAETEHIIRQLAEPVFAAAGLDAASVKIHLVQDSALNAFVAGGQRIFIYTGLILATKDPGQMAGIIAHETGHIAGGHLARAQEALRDATAQSIIAIIIGAAGIAAGGRNAGAAVILGGGEAAGRSFLQYSRIQESAADQAALRFLERTGQSARGLVEVLDLIGKQEPLRAHQNPYTQSHPLSRERISALQANVARSPYADTAPHRDLVEAYARLRAKLGGYIEGTATTLRRFPETDQSVAARYARALAYHKIPDIDRALSEVDSLLTGGGAGDPYFNELKGQILYENGRIAESIAPYRRAVSFAPGEPLLLISLAQALNAMNQRGQFAEAVTHLEEAVRLDPGIPGAWLQLAIAYGRSERFGLSSLASAERAFLIGRLGEAQTHARRAQDQLAPGTPGSLRAQDIFNAAARHNTGLDAAK